MELPNMLYFVIDYNHPTEGWIDALWTTGHRPFKAADAKAAARHFATLPEEDQPTHRYRRVEYGEFLDRGGI